MTRSSVLPAPTAPAIATGIASTRARYKKLNFRHNLHILKETDLDIVDDNVSHNNGQKAETGVEKSEESEYHLQAALRSEQAAAAGDNVKKTDIPVRPAVPSELPYDKFYARTFHQPATYIRFSSTVEDTIGCPYDLDDEDADYLKLLNKRRKDAAAQCSEDAFEHVMNGFEVATTEKQPYSAVDGTPVLNFEDLEPSLEEWVEDEHALVFAKDIYPHWKARRISSSNKPLRVSLKAETGADTDDADPYVCFRRRELRQTRKTRGRDAHSAEKLKKLRKELEEARELMALIKHREITKREQLSVEKEVFDQRTRLRQLKQNLPDQYKAGDEDLLINQKKKKPLEITQRQPGQPMRLPTGSDGKHAEDQLVSLADILSKQEKEIQEQIDMRIATHQKWNEGWVDITTAPLTPPSDLAPGSTFRTATTAYLPTPPASVSSDHSGDFPMETENTSTYMAKKDESITVKYAALTYDDLSRSQPSFRRRVGRGGRLWIDRRGRRAHSIVTEAVPERFKYDQDDEDEETPTYYFDPFSCESLQFRASMHRLGPPAHARRAQEAAAAIKAQGNPPSVAPAAPAAR